MHKPRMNLWLLLITLGVWASVQFLVNQYHIPKSGANAIMIIWMTILVIMTAIGVTKKVLLISTITLIIWAGLSFTVLTSPNDCNGGTIFCLSRPYPRIMNSPWIWGNIDLNNINPGQAVSVVIISGLVYSYLLFVLIPPILSVISHFRIKSKVTNGQHQ